MNAEKFWADFKEMQTEEFLRDAHDNWGKGQSFTDFIKPYLSGILGKNGFVEEHQYEYFNIDIIGWKQRKSELEEPPQIKGYRLNKHFWYLGVAVEHENNKHDWTDELVKLLYINCPLRVVIGYIPETLTNSERQQVLDYAATVVTRANTDANGTLVREGQDYLLILGNSELAKDGMCVYAPYVYKDGKFKNLEEHSNA